MYDNISHNRNYYMNYILKIFFTLKKILFLLYKMGMKNH